jgi:hypothetical protein
VAIAAAQQNEAAPADRGPDVKANIDVNAGAPGSVETTKTTWFVDPVWIALAVGAVILLAVLFAAGSRGGNTTVIKE